MKPFRKNLAIAIDGGGIRGVIVTKALSMLEEKLERPLHELYAALRRHFDRRDHLGQPGIRHDGKADPRTLCGIGRRDIRAKLAYLPVSDHEIPLQPAATGTGADRPVRRHAPEGPLEGPGAAGTSSSRRSICSPMRPASSSHGSSSTRTGRWSRRCWPPARCPPTSRRWKGATSTAASAPTPIHATWPRMNSAIVWAGIRRTQLC